MEFLGRVKNALCIDEQMNYRYGFWAELKQYRKGEKFENQKANYEVLSDDGITVVVKEVE